MFLAMRKGVEIHVRKCIQDRHIWGNRDLSVACL